MDEKDWNYSPMVSYISQEPGAFLQWINYLLPLFIEVILYPMNYSFRRLHELIRMIKYEVRKQFFLGREHKQSAARTRLALLSYLYLGTSRKLTDNNIGSLSLILQLI